MVHVVIPLYERLEYFKRCLGSVNSVRRHKIIVHYDGPASESVRLLCSKRCFLRDRPEHRGIAATLADAIRFSQEVNPEAHLLLLASDHLYPEGLVEAVDAAFSQTGPEFEFGKVHTHPCVDNYYHPLCRRKNLVRLYGRHSLAIVNELSYVCSMPSVVRASAASDLADFLERGDVSSISGVSVGRLFLTFWGIRRSETNNKSVFAIVGNPVEHMGKPNSKYWIKSVSHDRYMKKMGRTGQRVKPVGFYDQQYSKPKGYNLPYDKSGYKPLWDRVVKEVLDFTGPISVLDLGCGNGHIASRLVPRVSKYRGVDFSAIAIDKAYSRLSTFPGDWKVITGDINYSGFYSPGEFTHVLAVEVLEHVEDDLKIVSMISSGVRVVFTLPEFLCEGHVRRYPSKEFINKRFSNLVRFDRIEPMVSVNERKGIKKTRYLCTGVRL